MSLLSFPIISFYLAALIYGTAFMFYLIKKENLSVFFLIIAFGIHMLSELSGRYLVWPYCNMFSEPFFLPLSLSAISLILIKRKRGYEGLSILPLIVIFSAIAVFFSESYYPPFTILSKSIHSHLFHLFIFISHGCLLLGAYFALYSLIKGQKNDLSCQMVIWGFCFLSTAGLFGMLWSYLGRGDTISWNHYYFRSIAIWLYYAGFLHLRLMKWWDQKKEALILIAGFILIFLFDYLPQIGGIHIPGVLNVKLYKLY